MRYYLTLTLLMLITTSSAQRTVTLDLDRTVQLATDSSLTADRYRSVFSAAQHTWLNWLASRKTQFDLIATPFQFNQYFVQRYISETNQDEYRQQKQILSSAQVKAEQIMERWGGSFYALTGMSFMSTFGDNDVNQFVSVPIRVGYRQELFGFNPYKWNLQTEPMRLTVAEQRMNYQMEQTAEEAVKRFFRLALAQERMQMAKEYLLSCDTILAIANRRFRIASISKADLSILKLQHVNAQNSLANALLEYRRATRSLATWLNMEGGTELKLIVPNVLPTMHVEPTDAVKQAEQNNPHFLSSQLEVLEAKRESERLKRQKGLNATIDASVGLNQVSDRFAYAYRDPALQSSVLVTLKVPLYDHGRKRQEWLAAEQQAETVALQADETRRDTELDVCQTVADVNEQQLVARNANLALGIAEDAYTAMLQRFIRGQASVNDLSLAQNHWQSARQNQVEAVQNFWLSFYHLRTLTLHDYLSNVPIHHKARQ